MLYFKNNDVKTLFIHIPKTGGTSVEKYLRNKFNKDSLLSFRFTTNKISSARHPIFEEIKKSNLKLDEIMILSIVRNPYEKIMSNLFYNNLIMKESTKDEVYSIIKDKINSYIPQYKYLTDNNELIKNLILLRTEYLKSMMIKLGYTDFDLHENSNKNIVNYYDYLNQESINLINEVYSKDFELFGYPKI